MANRHFGKLADAWKHLVLAVPVLRPRPEELRQHLRGVRVVEGDGMTAVRKAVGDQARGTLVHTDPFEHRAALPGGLSALGLAQEAAERGAAVVYWYGYNRADQRRWIFDLLRANAPTIGWWCGDLMVSAPNADMRNGDLSAATSPGTGFGLVCANVSSASASSSASHVNTDCLESSRRPSLVTETSSAVRGPAVRIFAWNRSAST